MNGIDIIRWVRALTGDGMNRMMKSTLVGLLVLASTYAVGASPPPAADPASVHLSAMTVPFSSYASPQARQTIRQSAFPPVSRAALAGRSPSSPA